MNSLIIIGIIFIVSLILGFIKYYGNVYYKYDYEKDEKAPRKNAPWQWKFIEIWNCFVNFFLGGLIGYYLVSVRLNPILKGETPNVADFILMFILALCLTGCFPYLLKNITEGINAIISRIFK